MEWNILYIEMNRQAEQQTEQFLFLIYVFPFLLPPVHHHAGKT